MYRPSASWSGFGGGSPRTPRGWNATTTWPDCVHAEALIFDGREVLESHGPARVGQTAHEVDDRPPHVGPAPLGAFFRLERGNRVRAPVGLSIADVVQVGDELGRSGRRLRSTRGDESGV